MTQKPESPKDRLKRLPLWLWGLLCIVGGTLANSVAIITGHAPKPPLTDAQRGEAFGRGLATFVFVIVGVVLIILHFVRRKRRQ